MSTVRGRGRSLEIVVDRGLATAVDELRAQFAARPDFYRGSRAVANLGALEPAPGDLVALRDALAGFGITLDGVSGSEAIAGTVADLDLAYLGSTAITDVAVLPRRASARDARLSDDARSLVAARCAASRTPVRRATARRASSRSSSRRRSCASRR
jgi:hypothetical protein